jgi:hypothetical protein
MSENDIPPLSCEARLIDYISANLNTITRNIEQFASTGAAGFEKVTIAADETNDAVSRIGSQISGNLLGGLTSMAAGFGGVATAMVVYTKMKEGYEIAKKLQEAHVQLTAALGYYSAGLKKQADELSSEHKLKEEDLVQAQERLANYIKEESAVKALIPAVLNLAAAKGIDLARAADIVGRAINSNEMTIGRYGITLTGAAGSMEKVQSAIDGLNNKFKGQRDALDTTKTFWDNIGLSIHNALTDIGKFFTAQTAEETYQKMKKIQEAAQYHLGRGESPTAYGYSAEQLEQAAEYVANFETENNKKRATAEADQKAVLLKQEKDKLDSLREEMLKTTLEGQLTLLKEGEAKELAEVVQHTIYTEEQVRDIKVRYAQEISDKIKEINTKQGAVGRNTNVGLRGGITGVGATTTANAAATSMAMMSEGQEFLASMSPAQTDAQMEAAHQKYIAFEEEINGRHERLMNQSLQQQISYYRQLATENQNYYDKAKISEEEYYKNKELLITKELALQQKQVDQAIAMGEAFGNAIASGFEKGKYNVHTALRELLDLMVDALGKQAIAAAVSNTMQNITEEGWLYGSIIGAAESAGIMVLASAAKAAISNFAVGTRDAPGGWAMVGEQGPEMVRLPAHSAVYTNNETKNMHGDTIHFHFDSRTDSTTVNDLQEMLIEANRSGKLARFKSALLNN